MFWGEGSGNVYSMETCVVLVVCRCMSGVSGVSGFGTAKCQERGGRCMSDVSGVSGLCSSF